jgi:hypothetical protein
VGGLRLGDKMVETTDEEVEVEDVKETFTISLHQVDSHMYVYTHTQTHTHTHAHTYTYIHSPPPSPPPHPIRHPFPHPWTHGRETFTLAWGGGYISLHWLGEVDTSHSIRRARMEDQ